MLRKKAYLRQIVGNVFIQEFKTTTTGYESPRERTENTLNRASGLPMKSMCALCL